jgi:hypothetical protein
MLRKLPLNPERRLRVFVAPPRVVEGVLIQTLRIASGKALFAARVSAFTIFLISPSE